MTTLGYDLHFHSQHSDGRHPPARLARILADRGIQVAVLTDHDTLGGFPEFLVVATALGITTIPALELTTWLDTGNEGCEAHILAYGLRIDEELAVALSGIKHQRNKLHRRICEGVIAQGYDFDFQRLLRRAEPDPVMVSHYVWDYVLRHPVWATMGLVTGSLKRWFDRFETEVIGPGGKAYIPPPLSFADGIAWARKHGALAVVAHPRKINAGGLREAALAADVDGLEVFYEGQEGMQSELLDLVKQRDLVATGGSDWHGYFGGPYPGWSMPRESVNRLLERLGLNPL